MIQIDEPILSTGYYDLDLARNAVGIITKDITVPTAMHVCGDIMSVSEELNEFNVDILDHEFASNRKNLATLENIKKDIGFGCIDTKQKTVDSVDAIKDLIIEGIEILKNRDDIDRKKAIKNMLDKHVLIDPDCGMRLLPIDSAYQKLKNMVTAAEEVEREMKGC
jgi:5-methyltetrahydropteroyltriglutamate--homocysteine methyltransferase